MRPSTSLLAFVASATLLSTLFRSEPALADGCSAPSFAAARTFGAGASPAFVAVGDFNGDGNSDLAVANQSSVLGSGGVLVLLGMGDGTFQTAINYGAGAGPQSVAVGDFNGDGKLDLAVANIGLP